MLALWTPRTIGTLRSSRLQMRAVPGYHDRHIAGCRVRQLLDRGHRDRGACDSEMSCGQFIDKLRPNDLDPGFLMWAIERHVHVDTLPERRVVVQVDVRGRPRERWWQLLVEAECGALPGRSRF